jgi:hypothetical protein
VVTWINDNALPASSYDAVVVSGSIVPRLTSPQLTTAPQRSAPGQLPVGCPCGAVRRCGGRRGRGRAAAFPVPGSSSESSSSTTVMTNCHRVLPQMAKSPHVLQFLVDVRKSRVAVRSMSANQTVAKERDRFFFVVVVVVVSPLVSFLVNVRQAFGSGE